MDKRGDINLMTPRRQRNTDQAIRERWNLELWHCFVRQMVVTNNKEGLQEAMQKLPLLQFVNSFKWNDFPRD
jgi:hypothetical protein